MTIADQLRQLFPDDSFPEWPLIVDVVEAADELQAYKDKPVAEFTVADLQQKPGQKLKATLADLKEAFA